jgi:hypothetical protein
MSQDDDLGQLDELAGREKRLTVRKHEIVVSEVIMENLGEFVEACTPFLEAFDEVGELAARTADQPPDDFALFKLVSKHSKPFMRAAALVSNANYEFYAKLKPDEFFEVAAAVVEVNGTFFIQRLAPVLIRFARGVSQVGTMLLTGLSPTGMEALMSSSDSPLVPSTEL